MKEFFDIIIKYLNSETLQGAMTLVELAKFFAEIRARVQNSRNTLEDEAIFCLDEALAQFCENYGMEYDADVFYETFFTDISSIRQISSEEYQELILKNVINVKILTKEQKRNWEYFIDKVIAEKNLNILSTYLSRVHERADREKIPRILTELAPRPPVEEQLVERDEEKEAILDLINQKKKLVLVNGLGGVGKSTICKELFYYLKDKDVYERKLAWVTYNGNSLFNDFVEQFCYPEQMIIRREKITHFLQTEIDENAIIFVDNLNVRDVEEQFIVKLESVRCNVVCTSRITDYKHFSIVPVALFEVSKCIHLFKGYADISEKDNKYDKEIEEIVRRVGMHTLTIEILGKLSVAEEITPTDILERLKIEGINLEGIVEVDLKEDTLVGHLCKIFPVNRLTKIQKYILAHFANCPFEQIPKDLKKWIGLSNNYNIKFLKKYGWFVENSQSYYMHPIIKEVVKRICSLTIEDYNILIQSMEQLSRYNRNTGIEPILEYYPYIKLILKNTKGLVNPHIAWLHFNLACVEQQQGKYETALDWFRKALDIWSSPNMEGKEKSIYINARRANLHVQIGTCYYYMNDTVHAREWYDRTRYMQEPYNDRELTAQLYNDYALTYQADYKAIAGDKKRASEAKKLEVRIVKYFKKTIYEFQQMGKRDEFMAVALRNLGDAYLNQGKSQQAVDYFRMSMEIRERILDTNSPDREKNYYDLAKAFCALAQGQKTKTGEHVKYKIAYLYLQRCHKICIHNARKEINKVNLEELEQRMHQCEGELSYLQSCEC